jgi:hypothetical protein
MFTEHRVDMVFLEGDSIEVLSALYEMQKQGTYWAVVGVGVYYPIVSSSEMFPNFVRVFVSSNYFRSHWLRLLEKLKFKEINLWGSYNAQSLAELQEFRTIASNSGINIVTPTELDYIDYDATSTFYQSAVEWVG